jgi:hypothetical protein
LEARAASITTKVICNTVYANPSIFVNAKKLGCEWLIVLRAVNIMLHGHESLWSTLLLALGAVPVQCVRVIGVITVALLSATSIK